MKVVLYTRTGCHLCEEAKAVLERGLARKSVEIVEVDIDADPELFAQFDTCVPVVAIDGVVRFRGRVNTVLLDRLVR